MRHQSGWHNSYSRAVLAGLAAALLFAPGQTDGQNPAAGAESPSPAAQGAPSADQKAQAAEAAKGGAPGRAQPAAAKRAAGHPPKVGGRAATRVAQAGGASAGQGAPEARSGGRSPGRSGSGARSGGPVPGASGTGQLKSASGAASHGPQRRIRLDFRDVDIDNVLKFYGMAAGKTVVKDPGLVGPVTMMVPQPISLDQGLHVLEAVLNSKGYTLQQDDPILLRVVPQRGFGGFGGGRGGGSFGGGDFTGGGGPGGFGGPGGRGRNREPVITVFKLQSASAQQVARIIGELFRPTAGGGGGGGRGFRGGFGGGFAGGLVAGFGGFGNRFGGA